MNETFQSNLSVPTATTTVLSQHTGVFRRLLDEFGVLSSAAGYLSAPYHDPELRYFRDLPLALRIGILSNFTIYVQVCRETLAAGETLTNHKVFFWRMLVRLGLRPHSQLMNSIGSDDIIEIHDLQSLQKFRSLNLLHVCSYSIEELLCRPYFELFRRDDAITHKIMETAGTIVAAGGGECQRVLTGRHYIEEIDAPERRRSDVENLLMAPLFNDAGKLAAVMSTIRCYSSESQ